MKLDDKKPNRDDANRSFLKDFYSHAFKKSLPISIPVKSPSFLLGTGTTLSYSIQQEDINEFNYHYSIQQEAVNKFNYHLPPGGAPITLPLHKGIHVQGYLWELTTGFFNEFIWARISSRILSRPRDRWILPITDWTWSRATTWLCNS